VAITDIKTGLGPVFSWLRVRLLARIHRRIHWYHCFTLSWRHRVGRHRVGRHRVESPPQQGWASSCAGGAMAMRRGDVRGSWPWRGVGHSDGLRSIGG